MSAAICASSHSGPPAFGSNEAACASAASSRAGRSSGVTRVATCVISERNSREGLLYAAILIAGPTASGKSALALRLAERLGGAIINADSMQVYRDLHILTARPTQADEERVPHLYSVPLMPRRIFRLGDTRRRKRSARGCARRGLHPDLHRRHRALFQGAVTGFVRYTRCSRSHSHARARRCRWIVAPGAARTARRMRSAKRGAAQTERSAAHFACARSFRRHGTVGFLISGDACETAPRCATMFVPFHRAAACGAARRDREAFRCDAHRRRA